MRIVQITDLHIGLEGENTFDVDVRANFLKICQKVRNLAPDYLVVTGDLCFEDADPVIYQWIKQQLDSLEITYDLISGNHDDPVIMAQSFDREHLLADGELYFHRQLESLPYLYLDTTTGKVSEAQLKWLADTLKQHLEDLIIFMHHPPVLAGVPYMDHNYSLQNKEELLELLLDYPQRIDVFCGHYHVDKTVSTVNVNVHITPSCFFQIDQYSESFAVDHYRTALREIVISENQISHTVLFL